MQVLKTSNCLGNTAIIEKVKNYPYKNAPARAEKYRVTVSADYNNNFIFFVSCYETLKEAKEALKKLCFDKDLNDC